MTQYHSAILTGVQSVLASLYKSLQITCTSYMHQGSSKYALSCQAAMPACFVQNPSCKLSLPAVTKEHGSEFLQPQVRLCLGSLLQKWDSMWTRVASSGVLGAAIAAGLYLSLKFLHGLQKRQELETPAPHQGDLSSSLSIEEPFKQLIFSPRSGAEYTIFCLPIQLVTKPNSARSDHFEGYLICILRTFEIRIAIKACLAYASVIKA